MPEQPHGAHQSQEIVFELAQPQDDPAIRRLLARTPVPGQVVLSYEREPDYFAGCPVLGPFCQTLVARHRPTGQVVGLATRAVRPLWVNGQIEQVGYIGQLRIDAAFQGRWVLPQGFRLFHQLHGDSRATGYLTTIVEGNREAEGVLVTRARRHYPVYREVDRICTLALIVRRPRRLPGGSFELRTGAEVDLEDVIRFLHTHGPARQFFPAYTAADFTGPTTRDFRLEDLVVACRGGRIAGVLGLWDQGGFKQTVVRAYSPTLRRTRPLYDLAARVLGAQPLTPIGAPLHSAYAAFLCVAGGDPAILHSLLGRVYNMAAERRYAFLTLGLAVRDPMLAVARRYLHLPYYSTLYTVCWPGDEHFHAKLDGRIPSIEIAAL